VFAPSGDLYVAEQASGAIARIGAGGAVTRIASGMDSPHAIALDAEGNLLYVAEMGANRIALDTPSGAVATHIAGVQAPFDLEFSPQGELVVSSSSPGASWRTKGTGGHGSSRRACSGRTALRSTEPARS
jgi:DNA-binding beta-propeller fold protein YncE